MIADRLKAMLQAKNWTVAHCAKMTGVSESTISRILNGRGGETNMATIRALAEGLGCSLSDLLPEQQEQQEAAPTDASDTISMLRSHYDNMLQVIQDQYDKTEQAIERSRKRAQNRATVWATVAFIMLVALGVVSGAYIRFRWDVAHPTMGNIQYSSIAELREILGYGE